MNLMRIFSPLPGLEFPRFSIHGLAPVAAFLCRSAAGNRDINGAALGSLDGRLRQEIDTHFHTTFRFQFPRVNTTALTRARVENDTVAAQKTPRGPRPA